MPQHEHKENKNRGLGKGVFIGAAGTAGGKYAFDKYVSRKASGKAYIGMTHAAHAVHYHALARHEAENRNTVKHLLFTGLKHFHVSQAKANGIKVAFKGASSAAAHIV